MSNGDAEIPEPETNEDETVAEEAKTEAAETEQESGRSMLEGPRTWTMVVLTAVFVLLYVLALFGVIKAPADDKLLLRLEPIIFAIIGYYFGRVPSERAENRLAQEADVERDRRRGAESEQERQRVRAVRAETKIENARAALTTGAPDVPARGLSAVLGSGGAQVDDRTVRHAAASALRILESDS